MNAYIVNFIRRVGDELMCHSSCIRCKSDNRLSFLDASVHFVDCIGPCSTNCGVADSSSCRISDFGECESVCKTGLDCDGRYSEVGKCCSQTRICDGDSERELLGVSHSGTSIVG